MKTAGRRENNRVRSLGPWLRWCPTLLLCLLHTYGIWVAMGGRDGLTQPWPLARHDHPEHFHNATIARALLAVSGTTSGYDPSFMAGYAKSIVSDSSCTLSDVVVGLIGGGSPILSYKIYVLAAAALAPWLLAGSAVMWRASAGGAAAAVLLDLVYLWTDYPLNYVGYGMVAYFLSVPLGLFATGVLLSYLERGGMWRWAAAAAVLSALLLVHLTSAMLVGPAGVVAYAMVVTARRRAGVGFSATRHLGVWAIPALALAANAFWWLPGVWLAATKGRSDLAFAHPEPVLRRLGEIFTSSAPIESVLWAGLIVGLPVLLARSRAAGAALVAFLLAGFFWGYVAGFWRLFDLLQPGRHTYAFYTAAALVGGLGASEVLDRLRSAGGARLAASAVLALALVGGKLLGPSVEVSVRGWLAGPEPFLSSRPSPQLRWVVDRVRANVPRGGRLLYEEGGLASPGLPDVFRGGRYSGLLPYLAHVEVLGGPFLHVTLVTNFTQFGEGKLFGRADWGREHFLAYARLYRPSAILCWSPHARAFCRSNPDLVEILDDEGLLLIGRIRGFGGAAIEGHAEVEAHPGRLLVRAGQGGPVTLGYHAVPCLRINPPVPWEPVLLEQDPVPFIRLTPPAGADATVEVRFPPARGDRLGASNTDPKRGAEARSRHRTSGGSR